MKNLIIFLLSPLIFFSCKKSNQSITTVPAPEINSFSPTTANSGTIVTISGSNFTSVTAVSFGGTNAASFAVINANTITAVVAAGSTGSVMVTTQNGTSSLPGFVYSSTSVNQKGLFIHHANAAQCYGKAIATDLNDNIIVAELFQTNLSGKTFNSIGPIDALFSKYNKNGDLLWDKTAGGVNSLTTPHGVETDGLGNIYVTGYFGQAGNSTGRTVTFDSKVVTSKSDFDVFLAKYNSAGTIQWALSLGNTMGVTEERAWDIAVDASGNSYISGSFTGSVDFNPLGNSQRVLTSSGTTNSLFLAKYDANGINIWAIKVDANLGNVLTEAYSAIDLDNNGNIIFGGNYRNSIAIGSNNFTALGNVDIFVACFAQSNGTNIWAKTFGGAGNDILSPGALRVNALNEPHFTGRFAGNCNMGGTNITSTAGAVNNLYITALNASGNTKWALSVPSNAGQSGGHRVAFDATGNILVTGWFCGTAVINSNTITSKNASSSADVFLAKYTSNGTMQWFNTFGSVGYNVAGNLSISAGLAIDSQDNALITGKFYGGDVDWDPSTTSELKATSLGEDDGFMAKYKADGSLWQKP